MSVSAASVVEHAREILKEHNLRRLRELQALDADGAERLVAFLTQLRVGASFWAVASETQAEEFWDMVRGDDVVMQFVMSGTSELRLRLVSRWTDAGSHTAQIDEWGKLCRTLGHSYGNWGEISNHRNQTGSLIDAETLDRLPSSNFLTNLLMDNPWLVTLFLIETLPYLNVR